MGRADSFWNDYGFAKETLGSLMLRENNEGEEHWQSERDHTTFSASLEVARLLKIRTDHEGQSILEQSS